MQKFNSFLLWLDSIFYSDRKYVLGLFRDLGHLIRLYPILFRATFLGFLIYHIWYDRIWESVVAKIIVATLGYLVLRWIIPRRIKNIP